MLGSFYRGVMINGIPSEYRLRDQFGGDDVNDVIGLLPVLDSIPEMKGKKVAMWGVSRGGFMSFLAAKKTNRISTIISDSTPVDLVAEQKLTNRMGRVFETWIPGYSENKQEALKARSVRYWFSDLNQIPILILHGTKDRRVSPEIVLQFAQQLQKSDYPYQINFLKDGKHALRGYEEEVSSIINNWINNTSN